MLNVPPQCRMANGAPGNMPFLLVRVGDSAIYTLEDLGTGWAEANFLWGAIVKSEK